MTLIPHFAVPFRVENGVVATVEQDSIEEISQCVLAALETRIGQRVDEPEYGTPDQTFEQRAPELDKTGLLALVEEAEPRAKLLSEVALAELVEQLQVRVRVALPVGASE